ncbi:MAG: septum formation initiator family protein [Dysgonamonadaceae bacterium]|nr:septum formation initiator family protein [Dysgonamonadaceae bacterium]
MGNVIDFIKKCGRKLNKYWLTVIIFVIVSFFIGDNTILDIISYNRQISQLEKEIESVSAERERNLEKLNAIQSDNEGLEKFAREQYNMTRPNEELFLIVE